MWWYKRVVTDVSVVVQACSPPQAGQQFMAMAFLLYFGSQLTLFFLVSMVEDRSPAAMLGISIFYYIFPIT